VVKQKGDTFNKQLSNDRQQVLDVLQNFYGVVGVKLEFLAQGYSHKSYIFNAPILDGTVVVKIDHPGKARTDEDIYFESIITDFLADHGYPVQFPYKSLRGRYFERTEDERNVQVLKYIEAVEAKTANNKQKIIQSGRLLNRFHKISRHFRAERYKIGADLIQRRTFFLRRRLDALKNNLLMYQHISEEHLNGSGLTQEIGFLLSEYRQVNKLLNKRRKNLLPKYIIHGDYNPGNLIFNKSEIAGVIDFEHCAFGPTYWDIGFAIAHWSFLLNSYGVERITRYFVRGYAKDNGRISLRLVKAFRSFSALWRLSDAIRYYPKYKNKKHWEGEVKYYIKKCKLLAI